MIGLKFACAIGLVVAVAGCTPAQAPSSVAPTFACTPEAGGSPYACSSADFEEMKRKDALYAEAEQVFRRLVAEDERMYAMGGSQELSEEYRALLGTPALQEEQLAIQRSLRADKVKTDGSPFKVIKVSRLPGKSMSGSQIAVEGCVDLTGVSYFKSGRYVSKGLTYTQSLYLSTIKGRLAAVHVTSRTVPAC